MVKKYLGQHFLRNPQILRNIALAVPVPDGAIVVEIGPGEGTLTAQLLELYPRVVCIEKDHDLMPGLEDRFARQITSGQLRIVCADVLEVNDTEVFGDGLVPYVIIANIPYYITGAILTRYLSAAHQPLAMALVMQKEVAVRICAHDGEQSILSLSVAVYGKAKKIFDIARGSFSPPPNVDSALLTITNISRACFRDNEQEQLFFQLVKTGFAHKRKLLSANLKGLVNNEQFTHWCNMFGIGVKVRAEEVSLAQWLGLVVLIAGK